MPNNAKHRDYGGSSGTGRTSNFQSQTIEGNAGPGLEDHRALDERIRQDVNERRTQHSGIDTSHIIVEVHNRHVILKGTVASSRNVREAIDLVNQTPGVRKIESQLRVT
jgi:osmotically-inducible protein OsmY